MSKGKWLVYVLVSQSAGRTYVGISTDPERRISQHNGLRKGGARSTRHGRPWTIGAVYGPCSSRAEALRLERRLKKLRGRARLQLELAAENSSE